MKIVVVSGFYSDGMGYAENCLPKTLAALGHEVHVIASNFNVYGTEADYDRTYRAFLGAADQGTGQFAVDGYTVHRLKSAVVSGYVYINGLHAKIRELLPDIVHSIEIASLPTFVLAALKPLFRFKLFTETHQHLSVVKPFLKARSKFLFKKAAYAATRTVPSYVASLMVEKCYAISPDCAYVARKYYGVPAGKIKMQSLGTDTELFRPVVTDAELRRRSEMRKQLGYTEDDVICVYSGRLSRDKNPLLLAKAIEGLSQRVPSFRGLFVGDGVQKAEIMNSRNATLVPFMKHRQLAEFYRLADIAVWPTQESMSMLDAAASGLPLIVSDRIGERDRVDGNGKVFQEDNVDDLMRVLLSFASKAERQKSGTAGREKMVDRYSWSAIGKTLEADYMAARGR